jgi:CheY-like chemotaxis protein
MPIMSGGTSATNIREHEDRSLLKTRIPIFAVSASLIEEKKMEYCKLGFDGWILKPVDFGRLALLLEGIRNERVRKEAQYAPGNWERGGWFYGASTAPLCR